MMLKNFNCSKMPLKQVGLASGTRLLDGGGGGGVGGGGGGGGFAKKEEINYEWAQVKIFHLL